MFGLSNIIAVATYATLAKFPNEFKDYNKNCSCLHEIAEMAINELTAKHAEMFVKDAIKDFVHINDLAIGDKDIFEIEP